MASGGLMFVFKQGAWSNGLFDIKCPDCLQHCCCYCCTLSAIHKDVGSPFFSDSVAGLVACLGFGGCQLVYYGTKKKGMLEPLPIAIGKAWCCGSCYLHQQYKEMGGISSVINIASSMGRPAQQEMS
mmetsp:Transcript_417/g.526  ORF Transcript_417/g.526 Transcript_417/m.526 type:complete len:127 (-) Transcript_417:16-396(-)